MASSSRQKLQSLKEQLIAGKISEDLFRKLSAELEAQIAEEEQRDNAPSEKGSLSIARPAAPFGDHSFEQGDHPQSPPQIHKTPVSSQFPFGPGSAEMPLAPGMFIGEELKKKGTLRYEIGDLLGTGGCGAVFKALDHKHDPPLQVAIKAIFSSATADKVALKKIENEARTGKMLGHPSILKIWDFDEWMGIYFLVMEMVEGGDLNGLRAAQLNQRFSVAESLPYLRNIAEGLDYLHSKGIVHRDLKPSNLLWHPGEKRIKISDFGLSKVVHDSMQKSMVNPPSISGTFPYMAPEIWDAKKPSPAGDVYALGVIAYEMIDGEAPFPGPNYADQHRNSTPEPIQNTPVHIQTTISRALAKDPSKRFQSAGEFVDALASRPKKKRSILPIAIAAIFLVLLIAAGSLVMTRVSTIKHMARRGLQEVVTQVSEVRQSLQENTNSRERTSRTQPSEEEVFQLRIDSLLAVANVYFRDENFTTPAGENALETYREVLQIDDENRDARQGIRLLAGHYEQLGDEERELENWDSAIDYYELSGEIGGENNSLENKIATCRTRINRSASSQAQAVIPSRTVPQPSPTSNNATGSIKGKVIDARTGASIEGAYINIVGTSIGSYTENNGSYELDNVLTGTYDIRVVKNNYYPVEYNDIIISESATTQLNVEMRREDSPLRGSDRQPGSLSEGPLAGMQFAYIPAGSFMMGSPEDEEGRGRDEYLHQVYLDAFEIMTTEVTQEMWIEVMRSNPSYRTNDPARPVEQVSWNDTQDFLERLNRLDPGNEYRLPSEAEWEYACRAGTTTRFYCGEDIEAFKCVSWSARSDIASTQPVAQKEPNAWGLYDMHGNVNEWCNDRYHSDYASWSPERNPEGPSFGDRRVVRGGSVTSYERGHRSAARDNLPPEQSQFNVGFRIIRSVR